MGALGWSCTFLCGSINLYSFSVVHHCIGGRWPNGGLDFIMDCEGDWNHSLMCKGSELSWRLPFFFRRGQWSKGLKKEKMLFWLVDSNAGVGSFGPFFFRGNLSSVLLSLVANFLHYNVFVFSFSLNYVLPSRKVAWPTFGNSDKFSESWTLMFMDKKIGHWCS